MRQYILDAAGEPVIEKDIIAWGKWFQSAERVLASTEIGDAHVSTVFLGLDHGYSSGAPVLWETMIFGGEHDQFQRRYTSRADALEGHELAVDIARIAHARAREERAR